MGRGRKFLMDALPLAMAGVILRAAAVSFNAYVAKKVGAQAMGLYSLVMSVGTFVIVLASSGVNLAAVRLTAAAQADAAGAMRMRQIMRKCAIYSILFGGAACALLLALAEDLQSAMDLLLRIVPNGTCIHEDGVRLLLHLCHLVASIVHNSRNNFTISHIHLATICLQE